jgi:hypothetical protein
LHPGIRGVQETHICHELRQAAGLRNCSRTLYTSAPWSAGGLRHLPRHVWLAQFGRFLGARRLLPLRDRPATRPDLPPRGQLILRTKPESSTSAHEYCCRFFSFSGAISNLSDICWRRRRTMVHYLNDIVRIFPRQDFWQSIATAATWLSRLAHS